MLICIKSFERTFSVCLVDYNPVGMKLNEYPTVAFPYLLRHIDLDSLSSSCVDVTYTIPCAYFTYRVDLRNSEICKLLSAYLTIYEEFKDSNFFNDYPEVYQLLDVKDDEVILRES